MCLKKKTQAGKSRDYGDVIVFKKRRFQTVFHPRENELNVDVFKFLLFEELRFRDGLEWVVGLTVGRKLRFQFLRRWIRCYSFILTFKC